MPYKDPDKRRAYQADRVSQTRAAWIAANGPCNRCSSTNRLEVDHIDPEKKVDHKVWSWSPKRREEELKKCQVLCHDCHLKKTGEDQEAEHGTNGRYTSVKWRCRCPACRAAHAATNAMYR